MSTIVLFDRKGDSVDCNYLAVGGFPILVLYWHELQTALLQPVHGMAINHFINVMVQLLATHLNLFASRRLMLETLQILFKRKRPRGMWPTLSEWIELIERIHVNAVSRVGQYREALLFSLKGILNEFGNVVNYAASDLFSLIFSRHGCFVIITDGLSVDAASLLSSLFINYAYESRGLRHRDEPLIFVLDDALPLVRGTTAGEAEGGINPLSTWAFMGRSRRIGFVVSAQNFALISPVFRMNADSLLCFASYGRDAEELGRHLNLTVEQQAALPLLRPGEVVAIARSVYPLAVYGRVPEVP